MRSRRVYRIESETARPIWPLRRRLNNLMEIARFEQSPDVYHGDNCDERRPRWITQTRSGPDEAGKDGVLQIDCATLPAGTVVTVSVPECPECTIPAEDPVGGVVPNCQCGFDWEAWAGDRFS